MCVHVTCACVCASVRVCATSGQESRTGILIRGARPVFDRLSDFRYFSADTNPIFRYVQIFPNISTFGKVRNLRFLEKKAAAEVLYFLLKLLPSMPQHFVRMLCVPKCLALRCCTLNSRFTSIFTCKYHMPSIMTSSMHHR